MNKERSKQDHIAHFTIVTTHERPLAYFYCVYNYITQQNECDHPDINAIIHSQHAAGFPGRLLHLMPVHLTIHKYK